MDLLSAIRCVETPGLSDPPLLRLREIHYRKIKGEEGEEGDPHKIKGPKVRITWIINRIWGSSTAESTARINCRDQLPQVPAIEVVCYHP